MKLLFKKSWFIGTLIIGILTIVFFINLWIMSLKLTTTYGDNFWYLASNLSDGGYLNLFALPYLMHLRRI